MNDDGRGYVYIITNPSYKDHWVEFCFSSRKLTDRSRKLENKGSPQPSSIYASLQTARYESVAGTINSMIDMLSPRIRKKKGSMLFQMTPGKAYRVLESCAALLDDAELSLPAGGPCREKAGDTKGKKHPHKGKGMFGMLGIPVGSVLAFTEDESITVKVADQDTVSVGDLKLKISPAVRYIKNKLGTGNKSGSYRGGLYFMYDGERLTERRKRLGL
jgi:hypothetical protein